jgi:hypothetical protein
LGARIGFTAVLHTWTQKLLLHPHIHCLVPGGAAWLIHIRLQTWFPFQIQIYINGREWLARQLEGRGVGFERYQNNFLSIEDLPLAQRLCATFTRRRWTRLFDAFARRVNPWLRRSRATWRSCSMLVPEPCASRFCLK